MATQGKEARETDIMALVLLGFFFLSQHVFIFLLFSSSEDEGATLYSLFDLPLSHSFTGRPLGRGRPCRHRWFLALLPVLVCHRQQMSWFLREHPFLVASQTSKIKTKKTFPISLQTCHIAQHNSTEKWFVSQANPTWFCTSEHSAVPSY